MIENISDLSPTQIDEAIQQALKTLKPQFDPSTLKIGQHVPGKGLYAGTYEVEETSKFFKKQRKIFDLYAAEQDLHQDFTFDDTIEYLNSKYTLFGHSISSNLKDGFNKNAQHGAWFIPTIDMLENIKDHFNALGFKQTTYWSCTASNSYLPIMNPKYCYNFSEQTVKDYTSWILNHSTRLFRAELRSEETKRFGFKVR